MKNTFRIFINDIKALCKRPAAFPMIIGLVFLPGIYAWIYTNCTWNPYENVNNLPIAIVNKDNGASILENDINMGNTLVDSLKDNDSLKWIFCSDAEAKEKIAKSDVYGKIVFPEDFSKKLISIFETGEIQRPQLIYTINQKINPVTPLIVNKAVSTIQDTINQNIVNKLIFKALDKAENMDLLNKITESTDKVIDELEKSKQGISDLRAVFGILEQSANNTKSSLSHLRGTLPTVDSLTKTTNNGIANVQGAMDSAKGLSVDMGNAIASLEAEGNEVVGLVDFEPQKENGEIISGKIDKIDSSLTNERNKIQRVQSYISIINQSIPIPLDPLNSLHDQLQKILDEIDNTQTVIANNRQTKDDIISINKQLRNIQSQKRGVYSTYRDNIKNDLDNIFVQSSQSMDTMSNLLVGVNDIAQRSDVAIVNVIEALDDAKELTEDLDHVHSKLQKEIDKIIDKLQEAKDNELYNKLVNLMKNNPEKVADFLATPVKTNEINIFGKDVDGNILSYGSKLTPFYSTLAAWVGGVALISIVRTEVPEDMEGYKEFKNYEKFLGRFIFFGILAFGQGVIIGIGDLIIGVQALHPVAFVVTLMTCSLVYVFFIYTMAVSFGRIGHAFCIFAMVIQVAGSGGTYPIELLPRAYEIMQPIMPLYPGLNAIRETICGYYRNDYAKYMLMLLSHTIIPLLLGLIFRNPVIHLKQKFNRQLEKSHLISIV